jgi:hypothetical protein
MLPTSDLDPLILTAPAIRCGTTLLQRLICSASNGLMFGETVANDLFTALQLGGIKHTMYGQNRHQFATSLATFQRGDVNDWMIDLLPDVDGYLRAMVDGFLQPIAHCRDYARDQGRPVWGVKYPGWGGDVLNMLAAAMPRMKTIFIHRDVLPVLRSAKARRTVRRLEDARELCAQWAMNMGALPQLRVSPTALVIDYDDLVRDSEAVLQRVESFAGLTAIDRGVLSHRVNERDRYIEPATLTDEETAVAEQARYAVTASST